MTTKAEEMRKRAHEARVKVEESPKVTSAYANLLGLIEEQADQGKNRMKIKWGVPWCGEQELTDDERCAVANRLKADGFEVLIQSIFWTPDSMIVKWDEDDDYDG